MWQNISNYEPGTGTVCALALGECETALQSRSGRRSTWKGLRKDQGLLCLQGTQTEIPWIKATWIGPHALYRVSSYTDQLTKCYSFNAHYIFHRGSSIPSASGWDTEGHGKLPSLILGKILFTCLILCASIYIFITYLFLCRLWLGNRVSYFFWIGTLDMNIYIYSNMANKKR